MSEDPAHGAHTIKASKGSGNGGKLVLGAVAAALLLGGGYYAYSNYGPNADRTNIASQYEDSYGDDQLRAGPMDSSDDSMTADTASTDDSVAPPPASSTQRAASTPRRTQTAQAEVVPEETIGITPVNATTDESIQDSEEVIVRAPQRPVWSRTPSERRLTSLYPVNALERGREGEARLHCTVETGGSLDCARAEETRREFGTAALRVAQSYRHSATRADGSSAVGTPVNLRVVFRLDENDRRSQRYASR